MTETMMSREGDPETYPEISRGKMPDEKSDDSSAKHDAANGHEFRVGVT